MVSIKYYKFNIMKKILFAFAILSFTAFSVQAQEDPAKAFKKANRALSAYNLDPTNNEDKLTEAQENIDIAVKGSEESTMAKVWLKCGEIYNALVSKETNMVYVQEDYVLSDAAEGNALMAMKAYKKAHELAEKKYEKKDALDGLRENANAFNLIGNMMLQGQKYQEALPSLLAVLDIQEIFNANGQEPVFAETADLDNHKFVTAFCANIAGEKDKSERLFKELYDAGSKEPAVYSTYFSILIDKEEEAAALAVMDKGKELFPGNTDLLFAEINYYLKEGKMDELVGKLQTAIEKEPNNVSLYSTLGSVYDNLFQRELEAGNEELATSNFNSALEYYNKALEIKPDFFDATYSIGALYYNKAAAYTKELVELESDYSREGLKKYEAKKEEVFSYFDESLPFFKKAEQMNPNDLNTLIALKEIYARKNELDISNEFKTRMDKVQNGGSNETPYFNE